MNGRTLLLILVIFLTTILCSAVPAKAMTPPCGPEFPASGPGAISYPHAAVDARQIGVGEEKFFLFQPAQPAPASAPVLVFLHGWFATDPEYYRGWIDHLCRSGRIVIFPCFDAAGEPFKRYMDNAVRSVKEAFRFLYDHKRMLPDRDFFGVIGHECGAVLAANFASTARAYKLPVPGALFLIEPSRRPGGAEGSGLDVSDLSGIPASTRLVITVGEDDRMNGADTAREFFYAADNVPVSHKNFLTMLTDLHGTPALVADHLAPYAPIEPSFRRAIERRHLEFVGTWRSRDPVIARAVRTFGIDAMDVLGLWRVFDELWAAAYTGGDGQGALNEYEPSVEGNSKRVRVGKSVRFMGVWSDGKPIRGFLATKRP
ncbi:MAG: hypothetical protein HQM09_10565 [Candidatus Riflebacteria bacterium]|nr:hypothetical protein [Candidatus Riflebacteria bacterium]